MRLPQSEAVASNCTIEAAALSAGYTPETVLEVARQLIAIAGVVDGNYPGDTRISRQLLEISAVLTALVEAQT
jgi:hypothetical protein